MTAKPLDRDRDVAEIVLQHTLMRALPDGSGYLPSGDRPKRWLASVPRAWGGPGGHLEARLKPFLEAIFRIYNEHAQRMSGDPNYLALTSFTARVMDRESLLAEPWKDIARRQVWEPSTTYAVEDGAWCISSPVDFVPMALTALVVRGELASAELVDCVVALGFKRERWEERMRDPAGELQAALDHLLPALQPLPPATIPQ